MFSQIHAIIDNYYLCKLFCMGLYLRFYFSNDNTIRQAFRVIYHKQLGNNNPPPNLIITFNRLNENSHLQKQVHF